MKFAIIGCRHGHIGEFLREMTALGHTCVGICEGEGPLARAMAETYRVPLTADPRDIWEQEPEVVGSSAVNCRKVEILEECARRGVHFLADKPLAVRRQDLERAEAVLRGGSIQLGMLLTERWNPGLAALKQAIDQGRLGRLIGFTMVKPHKLVPESREPWHFRREENGGPIVDLMIHDFDLLRWFTGSEMAQAEGWVQVGNREGYPDFPDDARLLVRMENGVTASLQTDWWTPEGYPAYGQGMVICTGTRGRCVVHTTGDPMFRPGKGSFAVLTTEGSGPEILPEPPVGASLTEDFLGRIAGKPGRVGHEDILRANEAAIRADEAAEVLRSGS